MGFNARDRTACSRAWNGVGRPQPVQHQKDDENQTALPSLMPPEASGKPGSCDRAQTPMSDVETWRGSTKENEKFLC